MDREALIPIVACAFAFLAGSVPFGLLVARLFNVTDLRSQGSGNIGATNVTRVLGFWPAGAITFGLDVFKGVIPVLLVSSSLIGVWSGIAGLPGYESSLLLSWAVGFFGVLGHCFSPWLYFKGGKGVATGFGTLLVLSPWSALAAIVAFGLTFFLKRLGSLSSLAGLIVAAIAHVVLYPIGGHLVLGALMVAVIIFRHESNINALLEGREKAF